MTAPFRVTHRKDLFRGERTAKGHHECDRCGREIGPGERYWVRVILYRPDPDHWRREVMAVKYCCRRV